MKHIYKQAFILAIFSVLVSAAAIIHGIYFDMDPSEIKRLTLGGLLLTFIVIYPTVLLLEWIFDFDNKKRMDDLERRVAELEERS